MEHIDTSVQHAAVDPPEEPKYMVILTHTDVHLMQAALQQYLLIAQTTVQNEDAWQATIAAHPEITPTVEEHEAIKRDGLNHIIAMTLDSRTLLRELIEIAGDLAAPIGGPQS